MEEIYKKFYHIVYGYLFNLCKDKNIAEELSAETFFKAIQNYKKFDGKGKVSTWLCQIAKNEYFRFYNKNKNINSLETVGDITNTTQFEDLFEDKSMAIKIHKHLHSMQEPYKEVFILRVFAELSFAEIAVVLDKTENWARVIYYRAKQKLLAEMEDIYE